MTNTCHCQCPNNFSEVPKPKGFYSQRFRVTILLYLIAVAISSGCKKNNSTSPADLAPTITNFSPSSGTIADQVIIKGTNFSATALNNAVKSNGIASIVSAASATQLTTTVPVGATTGTITVKVNGEIATSTASFTILASVNNCKVATVTDNYGHYFDTLIYEDHGKLLEVRHMDDFGGMVTSSFSYKDNNIFIYRIAGANFSRDTIVLNTLGLISTETEHYNNQSVYYNVYVHDANGLLTSSSRQQDNYVPDTFTYTNTDGDVTYIQGSNGEKDTTDYYTDKLSIIGAYTTVGQLINYGALYDRSKHLRKSVHYGTYLNYSYAFDADGKIISNFYETPTTKDTIHITYICP